MKVFLFMFFVYRKHLYYSRSCSKCVMRIWMQITNKLGYLWTLMSFNIFLASISTSTRIARNSVSISEKRLHKCYSKKLIVVIFIVFISFDISVVRLCLVAIVFDHVLVRFCEIEMRRTRRIWGVSACGIHFK